MTVSKIPQKHTRYNQTREYLFIFPTSDALTLGILFLYKIKPYFKSSLYKTENDYRLIISSKYFLPCFLTLSEFCTRWSSNTIETAYTKEYGKLLIKKYAVKTFGKHFSKGS